MEGSDSTIITIFIVSTLIVLVLVVTIVSFVLLYQRKVLQQQMTMQNREVDFQRELMAATLESQEVERKRIAKDLHDSVGVMLSTLQLIIKQYGSKGEPDPKRTEIVEKSSEIIQSTITTVRRISHDLLPPELAMLGLKAALERTADDINQTGQLHVHVEFPQQYERLPIKHETILFRVAQELLNNTLKHSGASEATITLQRNGQSLAFSYTDNGKGIPDKLLNPGEHEVQGIGLKNIEGRSQSLGANVSWGRNGSSGMRLDITLKNPLTV